MRRYCRYRLLIPVFRSPHSAEFTARGVANGVFWGLTPSVGLQTIEILATWFIARRVFKRDSSLLQAFIWVWVNNPITMVPMYYAFYITGLWLMGAAGPAAGYDSFVAIFENADDAGWFARTMIAAQTIGIPTAIGSIPYATAGAALSYWWALRLVSARRRRIAARGAVFSEV